MNPAGPESLHHLVEFSWSPAVLLDAQGRILKANRPLCELLDTEPANLEGLRALSLIRAPENPEDIHHARERLLSQGFWKGQLELLNTQGKVLAMEVRLLPAPIGSAGSPCFLAFLRDKNDASSREQRFEQVQSIVSKANLTGGVAHHFNNVLATIILQAELVRMSERPFEKIKSSMEKIIQVAQKGSETLRQFQEFRYQEGGRKEYFQPRDCLEKRLHLLRTLAPSGVNLQWDLSSRPLQVFGREDELHTAVTNLVINAWEAFPQRRGSIDVKWRSAHVAPPSSPDGVRLSREEFGLLEVLDNGEGFSPDLLEQACDPFVTTRNPAEHLGMGLTVVHAIIDGFGGWMQWENRPEGGAAVRLYFPLSAQKSLQQRHQALMLEQIEGKILLVDDEVLILEAGRALLGNLGFTVEICPDPRAALDLAKAASPPFDLVLTDFNMPGLTGLEFAGLLRQGGFTGRILLSTGILKGVTPDDLKARGIDRVLLKPCSVLDLAAAIQEVLQSPTASAA